MIVQKKTMCFEGPIGPHNTSKFSPSLVSPKKRKFKNDGLDWLRDFFSGGLGHSLRAAGWTKIYLYLRLNVLCYAQGKQAPSNFHRPRNSLKWIPWKRLHRKQINFTKRWLHVWGQFFSCALASLFWSLDMKRVLVSWQENWRNQFWSLLVSRSKSILSRSDQLTQ